MEFDLLRFLCVCVGDEVFEQLRSDTTVSDGLVNEDHEFVTCRGLQNGRSVSDYPFVRTVNDEVPAVLEEGSDPVVYLRPGDRRDYLGPAVTVEIGVHVTTA